MNFLWDTNILLHCVRRSAKYNELNQSHDFLGSGNQVFLSVVNIGEIESIAYQRNWAQPKWNELQSVVGITSLLSIYEEVIHAYARIDAFSQGKQSRQTLWPAAADWGSVLETWAKMIYGWLRRPMWGNLFSLRAIRTSTIWMECLLTC